MKTRDNERIYYYRVQGCCCRRPLFRGESNKRATTEEREREREKVTKRYRFRLTVLYNGGGGYETKKKHKPKSDAENSRQMSGDYIPQCKPIVTAVSAYFYHIMYIIIIIYSGTYTYTARGMCDLVSWTIGDQGGSGVRVRRWCNNIRDGEKCVLMSAQGLRQFPISFRPPIVRCSARTWRRPKGFLGCPSSTAFIYIIYTLTRAHRHTHTHTHTRTRRHPRTHPDDRQRFSSGN